MVLMCVSLSKDLRTDPLIHRRRRADQVLATLAAAEERGESDRDERRGDDPSGHR